MNQIHRPTNFKEHFSLRVHSSLIDDFNDEATFNKVVKFPILWQWFSWKFRMSKDEARVFLKILEEKELVKRAGYVGILVRV